MTVSAGFRALLLASLCCIALHAGAAQASNLSYVVKVNGEPITSYDLSQRQKFRALTSGALGKRMRALMNSESVKKKFEQFMRQQKPTSRAEAQELQKQFVSRMQRQLLQDIVEGSRDKVLQQLIDERIMLQEAKRHKVSVSEAEVTKRLTKMAQSGSKDRTLEQFLGAFRKQGVHPETIRQRIRAQLAWRQVIRKVYGFRIASIVGAGSSGTANPDAKARDAQLDVGRLRLSAAQGSVARAYVKGQAVRKQFSSCSELERLSKQAGGASLQRFSAKTASFFPRDARPLLIKAEAGQMLPPMISSKGVDLYAVCGKKTPKADDSSDKEARSASDRRQQEFQIYAKRHLTDLRQDALIERR